jgi:hypothetical protein
VGSFAQHHQKKHRSLQASASCGFVDSRVSMRCVQSGARQGRHVHCVC